MREWIQKRIPTEESLKSKPGLRWLGPLLRRRWLWHLNRRTVSIGVGVGVFFGFLIPIMQIAGAALDEPDLKPAELQAGRRRPKALGSIGIIAQYPA
jgi:hypothetical protein